MVSVVSVGDRKWVIRNFSCASPCSTYRSLSPSPPKCAGAYTTCRGICLLNPIFGSMILVTSCCDLRSWFGESVVADIP
jgi:hypothetical protein